MVRIPQITDIETAIEIYYSRLELGNKEIRVLFGAISGAKVVALKELAREKMREDDIMARDASRVNTTEAYKAWGLDIADLEHRHSKLQKLALKTAQSPVRQEV